MTSKIVYWVSTAIFVIATLPVMLLFRFLRGVHKFIEYVTLHAVYDGDVEARNIDRWRNDGVL